MPHHYHYNWRLSPDLNFKICETEIRKCRYRDLFVTAAILVQNDADDGNRTLSKQYIWWLNPNIKHTLYSRSSAQKSLFPAVVTTLCDRKIFTSWFAYKFEQGWFFLNLPNSAGKAKKFITFVFFFTLNYFISRNVVIVLSFSGSLRRRNI